MRTKVFTVSVLIILVIMGFVINNKKVSKEEETKNTINNQTPPTMQNNSWLDKFHIGAVDCDYDYPNNYPHLKQLGFDLWHSYVGEDNSNPNRAYPKQYWANRFGGDSLMASVSNSTYLKTVNDYINQIYGNGDKLIIMRPKIEWLCHGQRSDYKCAASQHIDPDLWFYGFQSPGYSANDDYYDNTAIGDNKWVRQCLVSSTTHGFIVSRLKSNTEQCYYSNSQGGNEWQGDSQCDWLIKPKIRIDSSFANNLSNAIIQVCRVDIKNQGDTLIKSFDILARDFRSSDANRYLGNYLEEFYFVTNDWQDTSSQTIYHKAWGDKYGYCARGDHYPDNQDDNHADIRVYWYGNCDMWIDYVRVDNDVADKLFSGYYDNPNDPDHRWIYNEATQIGYGKIMKYYLELVEFNNIPCMAYVNSRLKQYSGGNADLIQDLNNSISAHVPWDRRTSVENPTFLYNQYIQKVGLTQVFGEAYPMTACFTSDTNQQCFSKIPNTLLKHSGDSILAKAVSPAAYDDWLQDNINCKPYCLEEGVYNDHTCFVNSCGRETSGDLHQDQGNFRFQMQLCDAISKLADIPFIMMPQAHQWFLPGEVRREPTNEELNMMANVGVSYGVRGMIYFMYASWIDHNSCRYASGITLPNDTALKTINYYGESNPDKKQTFQGIVNRLSNKWGPYLMSFNNTDRHSYIYNDETERGQLVASSYISSVTAFKPGSGTPSCPVDNPAGLTNDCPNDSYLQVATFKNTEQYSRYFMLVNRRCSPYIDETTEDRRGGRRFMRVQFKSNSSEFAGFNNWKVINTINDSVIATFNKTVYSNIDLDWFMPGEGRLYKISPVMVEGGTLVSDESLSNSSFNCNGMIYNGGHKLTFARNCHISFDSSAGIVINGGNFISSGVYGVTLQGKTGMQWKGIDCVNCDTVSIAGTTFNDLKPNNTSGYYPLSFNDCAYLYFSGNTVNATNTTFNGILDLNLDGSDSFSRISYVIYGNTLNLGTVTTSAISFVATSALQIPVYIQNNNIVSNSSGSANGLYLSNVSLGVISGNTISNFTTGIMTLSSSADIYGNTISSSSDNSFGIKSTVSGTANLSPSESISGTTYVGGNNTINNTGSGATDLHVENSYFVLSNGSNTFNIHDTTLYHLSGYIPNSKICRQYPTDISNNCFKVNGNAHDKLSSVTCGSGGSLLNYTGANSCNDLMLSSVLIIPLTNDINDTIWVVSGGSSGGVSSNEHSSAQSSYNNLRDSININMRMKKYSSVISGCTSMLDSYPDSSYSIDALSKLYVSSLLLDSNGNKMSPLKSFYETLILNNPDNTALITRANYFVQKSKVALKQYTSALQGFQDIINQNPYSYEGLVASWDYAATQLLANSGGGFANEAIILNVAPLSQSPDWESDNNVSSFASDVSQMMDTLKNRKVTTTSFTNEKYDQSRFSQKDRESIKTNVENSFKDERSKQITRLQELEKSSKSENKTISSNARKELKTMKAIGESVKVRKPKDKKEHIQIINSDIKKYSERIKLQMQKM